MRRDLSIRCLLFAVALGAPGCPGIRGPQLTPILADGTYTHPASGLAFPETVGGFQRGDVTQFDEAGRDVGAGYDYEEADAVVTVTVYVRPPLQLENGERVSLGRQFALERALVHRYHQGAVEVWASDVEFRDGERALPGYSAELHFEERFVSVHQRVVSFLYLFERDGWTVKYRITYAAVHEERAAPVVVRFLKSAPWGTCGDYRCTWRR